MSGALYALKTVVAQHPSLALPIARLRGHGVLVDPDTEVLIEGYPRSANSFSVAAFEMAQGRKTRIAHHTHAPAHVLRALALGVPAIVLIRDPEDAVLEFMLVRRGLQADRALRGYVRFYEPLIPHRHRFVLGAFPEVTTDFGRVIRRVNELFGTSFAEFVHTTQEERAVFEAMEGYWQGRLGSGDELERRVGRPSLRREELKAELRPAYRAVELAGLRERAGHIFRLLAEERA
jgi:hypothetical protein